MSEELKPGERELLKYLAEQTAGPPERLYEAHRQQEWDHNLPEWSKLSEEDRAHWYAKAQTAGPRCPKCGGDTLTVSPFGEIITVQCNGCPYVGNVTYPADLSRFAQFFPSRLPSAEHLAKALWMADSKLPPEKWEATHPTRRDAYMEQSAETLAALASISGEPSK